MIIPKVEINSYDSYGGDDGDAVEEIDDDTYGGDADQ